ncbi:helix-turn-helix domain-containing protein [Photobacterium sp. GJ3]|uniref:helix-turn-helix domain-containing protein n=1 Tax=Photobacterium sp. GJ3 TaxID=2829502 RepID=UPI001B8D7541|nr:AraC family transcriptional regulator [Photobacterium sp. GJ3]QUJ69094.1 helix-turn-helix domain-containing protein [Photobacterium sp. GJ3]
MKPSLSIRSYTKQLNSHVHDCYHQLVLPIQGNISIDTGAYTGKVTVGECVVIPKGVAHAFKADEAARFIVADLDQLPANLLQSTFAVFSISLPLLSFIQFVEKQLESQVDSGIEASIIQVFTMLLGQQEVTQLIDPRIRAVQAMIIEQLDQPLSITALAQAAYLSPTQFKKTFKENLGTSVHKFITQQRMEKAKALLTHTDLPVQLVAEKVGYSDLSAFSRRFSAYFGMSPRTFSRS